MRAEAPGWTAAVLTSAPELGAAIGLRPASEHPLFNGPLACSLLLLPVPDGAPEALPPGAEMFANRLRKNLRRLGRWAKKEQVGCYRLYDADMPEYAVAVDLRITSYNVCYTKLLRARRRLIFLYMHLITVEIDA